MDATFKRIYVIVNPASGNNEPILNTLNDVFRGYEVQWQIDVTAGLGDGEDLARKAAESGEFDLVAAYGGDGTIGEVARGMAGTGVPLALLPGGTANALAMGLRIPFSLPEAADMIFHSRTLSMDLGEANGSVFTLRADTGITTRMAQQANRELKDRYGLLAYALSWLQTGQPEQITYRLTVDGEQHEAEGIACIVTNHNELGALGLKFTPNVSADDGLLDAFVVKDTISALGAVATQVVVGVQDEELTGLEHWQGREFTVETDQPQDFSLDGDPTAQTPLSVRVLPGALKILVPPEITTLD